MPVKLKKRERLPFVKCRDLASQETVFFIHPPVKIRPERIVGKKKFEEQWIFRVSLGDEPKDGPDAQFTLMRTEDRDEIAQAVNDADEVTGPCHCIAVPGGQNGTYFAVEPLEDESEDSPEPPPPPVRKRK